MRNGTGEDTDCQNLLWNFEPELAGEGLAATLAAGLRTTQWHSLNNYFKDVVPKSEFPAAKGSPVTTKPNAGVKNQQGRIIAAISYLLVIILYV